MLKTIRDQLKTDIKATNEFQTVDKYRGEFEDGSEWNPTATACFLQVIGFKPRVKAADGNVIKSTVLIRIYAGAFYKHDRDALDSAEFIFNLLDGHTLESGDDRWRMSIGDEGMDLIYSEKGFEAYAFNVIIS